MPRTRTPKTPPPVQAEPATYASNWRDITLLVAYLVIFALSILTVLLPSTDNQEERVESKNASTAVTESTPK